MRFATHYRGQGPQAQGWHPGLGDTTGAQLGTQVGGSINAGLNTANATGSVLTGAIQGAISATGAVLGSTALFTTAAGSAICPPCAPIFMIGALLVPIIAKVIEGCGNSCIEASDYANQIEPLLVQNLNTYTNTPAGQRTVTMQQAAINNFNASFSRLVTACQNIGGQGGTNCIKDRQAGGCKWKATPWKWNSDGTFTPAGAAGSGSSCWNWVYGYHDPIANDPYVVPDSTINGATTELGTSLSSAVSTLTANPLLLIAAAIGLYLVIE